VSPPFCFSSCFSLTPRSLLPLPLFCLSRAMLRVGRSVLTDFFRSRGGCCGFLVSDFLTTVLTQIVLMGFAVFLLSRASRTHLLWVLAWRLSPRGRLLFFLLFLCEIRPTKLPLDFSTSCHTPLMCYDSSRIFSPPQDSTMFPPLLEPSCHAFPPLSPRPSKYQELP